MDTLDIRTAQDQAFQAAMDAYWKDVAMIGQAVGHITDAYAALERGEAPSLQTLVEQGITPRARTPRGIPYQFTFEDDGVLREVYFAGVREEKRLEEAIWPIALRDFPVVERRGQQPLHKKYDFFPCNLL